MRKIFLPNTTLSTREATGFLHLEKKIRRDPRFLLGICLSGECEQPLLRAPLPLALALPRAACTGVRNRLPSNSVTCGDASHSGSLLLLGPFLLLTDLSFIAGLSYSSVSLLAWAVDHQERVSFQPVAAQPSCLTYHAGIFPFPGSDHRTGIPTECAV